MDKDGRKMSKSIGNVILPDDLINQYGADVVRLWVVSSDFTEDLRIGQEIMKANVCLLYTSPSPRDATLSRMPSSA